MAGPFHMLTSKSLSLILGSLSHDSTKSEGKIPAQRALCSAEDGHESEAVGVGSVISISCKGLICKEWSNLCTPILSILVDSTIPIWRSAHQSLLKRNQRSKDVLVFTGIEFLESELNRHRRRIRPTGCRLDLVMSFMGQISFSSRRRRRPI